MEPYPYGWRYQLVPHEAEQQIVKYIGDLHFNECLSQHQIVRRLNEEGVTCRGRRWNQTTISRLIKREFPGRMPSMKHGWRSKKRREQM